jgi:hypothetical protein
MRTTFEFEATGTSHEELQRKAEELVARYLNIELDSVESKTDIEMNVKAENDVFTAKVHVRIK